MRVWIDQGGTFTDVLRVQEDGRLHLDKVLSDAADLERQSAGAELRAGTTVATNALLERQGAPTLLITTQGFGDLPRLGDQTRPRLFDLHPRRPPPLCAGVLEVPGRIDAQGRLLASHTLDLDALARWVALGVRSAAVVLVGGPLCPDEERRLGALARQAGMTHVSLGHEVAPSRGFLARLQTTLADATLTPLLPRAPGRYLRSDGGLSTHEAFRGADAVLSGPSGGVIATAALATRAGLGPCFGLDMGGTSTDVCRVDGPPERTDHLEISGLRLRVPAVQLQTVAAGGGSILGVQGGVYTVGPRSAGAHPGPAAYGRGGPATVTDADVVLGRLPVFPAICGPGRDQPLDSAAAAQALQALDPDRPLREVAVGYRALADEHMAAAVHRLAASLGVDPSAHALVAFGGAGPGHAPGVARRLGIRTVVIPVLASAFSALGVGLAPRRAERVAPVRDSLRAARDAALALLPFDGEVSVRLAARHRGTSTLLEIPLDQAPEGAALDAALTAAFHAAHQRRFGFARPDAPIEAVEVRAAVEQPEPAPPLQIALPDGPVGTTWAWFDGWREVPLVPLARADGLVGPALIVGLGTTISVEPGWRCRLAAEHLHLQFEGEHADRMSTEAHPLHTAVLGSRIMAIAEQMGEQLGRLSRSVSIRERRDCSCAVFDAQGRLVANAPHIPVHLGAMGETVRDLLTKRAAELQPGQAWVTNDPYAGGSHLPDITVIAPVFVEGQRLGLVACRGHHVDVGGITPGSMPPFARTLDEEGLVLPHQLLSAGGRFLPPDLPGCREPATVLADLMAQVASVSLGADLLGRLAQDVGADVLRAQLGHLQAAARRAVEAVLRRLGEGRRVAEDTVCDRLPVRVTLDIQGGRARVAVDAPRDRGNLNAPRSVGKAALLYAFRCLVDDELPLNEGALDPFDLDVNPGGLLDPRWPAAVAGGNVETSQILVDAILRATGALAAGQGTMNNLTVGTAAGAWYETLGGGSGAGPGGSGASGWQVHMTNTRATDVEELEARFPVRLEQWTIRRGSGGAGAFPGGDGVVKVWTFLAPAEVALLAGRRAAGAPGLAGGGAGAPGLDLRDLGAGWEPAPPVWTAKAGDRLRIETPGGGGWGPLEDVDGAEGHAETGYRSE